MDNEQKPQEILSELKRELRRKLKHEQKKVDKQTKELEESKSHIRYTQLADSLMAEPRTAPRGTKEIELTNVHTGSPEKIALNPKLDANQNAQLLYKKARKGRRGYEVSLEKVEETKVQIGKIEKSLSEIDSLLGDEYVLNTITEEKISEIKSQAALFIQTKEPLKKGKKEEHTPFRKFKAGEWDIFLGRNSRENDEISTRFAKPSDIWLHVAAHSGSHVIIRRPKNSPYPPKDVVEKAASLAVWYSKAKHTSFAEVHVTEARFVHKRRKAPPGEVIAERCKTVRVEPKDPQELFPSSKYA
ncbi:hypothetical protein CHISP_3047 [Chitinispirillum alkaliphilum]|nr:hypothetical protein CHISP_3047 [Chitinispirillum alkaliphilum]